MQLQWNQQKAADFAALYQRHYEEVWALAYAHWKDADTAMDITQETFLRLLKKWQDGEVILNPRALLLVVARNLAKDYAKSAFRRNGTHPPQLMNTVKSHQPAPDESAHRNEEAAAVRAALVTLSRRDRALLVMHIVRGMTIREIAFEIQVPRSTVWSSIGRALRRLRQRLAHLHDTDMDPGIAPGY